MSRASTSEGSQPSMTAERSSESFASPAERVGMELDIRFPSMRMGQETGPMLAASQEGTRQTKSESSREPEKSGSETAPWAERAPVIFPRSLGQAEAAERSELLELILKDQRTPEEFGLVSAFIQKYRGLEQTIERASSLVEEAKAALAVFPDGEEKSLLTALGDYVVSRRK